MAGASSTLFVQKEDLGEVRRRLKRYQQFKRLTTAWVQACLALARKQGFRGRRHEGASVGVRGVKKNGMTRLAKQTGFQQRQGRLTPYEFLVLLTVGDLGMPHPSLGGMVAGLPSGISREALHQRFTAPAAAFLRHCLHAMLRHKFPTAPVRTSLLRPFARVLLVDNWSWDVSEKLRAVLPGAGGNASKANDKIQAAYDYKQGALVFLPGHGRDRAG